MRVRKCRGNSVLSNGRQSELAEVIFYRIEKKQQIFLFAVD